MWNPGCSTTGRRTQSPRHIERDFIMEQTRQLSFGKAINEALVQAMELSADVAVWGQIVDYKAGVFGTTTGLVEKFGTERVQDFPVAEAAMTSAAIGAALTGLRPVLVHQRLEFMIYSLDA